MAWTTPTLVEICIGLEINGYLPAEFWFRPFWSVTHRLVFCWPTCRLAWAGDARVRPAKSAAVKRGFSFPRYGQVQVVECAELPAWLLPNERYRRSSSRIARWRL